MDDPDTMAGILPLPPPGMSMLCILQSPTRSHGHLMDTSWTLHNLLKSHDNPFKVLWSPHGVLIICDSGLYTYQ